MEFNLVSSYEKEWTADHLKENKFIKESFFMRHAYFTGADDPYEKPRRTLRAELDEAAWSSLYTTNYPFEKPKSGKFAVKVINHYGDEVLKVYTL